MTNERAGHLIEDAAVIYHEIIVKCKCATDKEILYPVIDLMIKNYAKEICESIRREERSK